MFETILLPTEAGPGAEDAIDLAVDLAGRYGAELHVLYVAEDTEHTLAHLSPDDRRANLPPEGDEALDVVEATARNADVPVRTRVGVGDPEHSIIQHGTQAGADLVVMGTHGRTGVDRLLVGSVAESVVRRADVPVLVVPLDEREA